MGVSVSESMTTSKHSAPLPRPDKGTHSTPRRGAFYAGSLCVLLTLAGCVPERQWKVPGLSGTVTADGQPAGGVKVLITRTEGSCNEPVSVQTTDAQGRFSYEGLRELGTARIFTSPEQTYSICLQSDGSPVLGLSRRVYGPYSHAEVRCELKPTAATPRQPPCTIGGMN